MKNTLLFLSILSTFSLSACNGSDTGTTDDAAETPRFVEYKTGDFQMEMPEDWEIVNSFSSDYPAGIRVAFKNNLQESDFVANVTVIREENADNLTSYDFTQSKLADHEDHLLNYELLSQEELSLKVGSATSVTMLNTFEGKNEATSETLQFMQTALTKGDRAWVVTASYAPNEDEFTIDRMVTMLSSFQLQ